MNKYFDKYIFYIFTCKEGQYKEEPDQIRETPNDQEFQWVLEPSISFKMHQTLPIIPVPDNDPPKTSGHQDQVEAEYKARYPPSFSRHGSIEESNNYGIFPIGIGDVQTLPIRLDLTPHP